MSVGLSHSLRNSVANTVSASSHDNDLASHLELLQDIGGGVGKGSREAIPEDGTVGFVHRHLSGDLAVWCRTRIGHILNDGENIYSVVGDLLVSIIVGVLSTDTSTIA
jgi:hypothetical protein